MFVVVVVVITIVAVTIVVVMTVPPGKVFLPFFILQGAEVAMRIAMGFQSPLIVVGDLPIIPAMPIPVVRIIHPVIMAVRACRSEQWGGDRNSQHQRWNLVKFGSHVI